MPFRRPELFAAATRVVSDDRVGGGQNDVRGTIVLLQLDDLHFRVMLFHVEQVGDLRAAPAVNALVIVAHHAEVAMLPRQRVHQPELSGVRVLIFVHHHVTILRAAAGERVRMLPEQSQRQQNEVVKIHCVARAQSGLVARMDVPGHRGRARIAK